MGIHIWTVADDTLFLEIRSTHPNLIRNECRMILPTQTVVPRARHGNDGIIQIPLSEAEVQALALGLPAKDGSYFEIALIHSRLAGAHGNSWGWTYRIWGAKNPADSQTGPVPQDADGWVLWALSDMDFGSRRDIVSGLFVDFIRHV